MVIGGKILNDDYWNELFLIRIGTDGLLDSSFANDGFFVEDLSTPESTIDASISAISVHSDGKIVAAGLSTVRTDGAYGNTSATFIQLNEKGQKNTKFASNGIALVPIGPGFQSPGQVRIAIQTDGKVVAGVAKMGSNNPKLPPSPTRVLRLTVSGNLDVSFSEDGVVEISDYQAPFFGRIEQLKDGRIFCLSGLFQMTRLHSDGTFDTSFGSGGQYLIHGYFAFDYALLPTGKILVSGYVGGNEPPFGNKRVGLVARFHSDGYPDVRFGQTGITKVDVAGHWTEYAWMFLRNDGYLLTLGWKRDLKLSIYSGEPVLSRFHSGK